MWTACFVLQPHKLTPPFPLLHADVLQLSRSDLQCLSVDADLSDVKRRVALQLLSKTYFFKHVAKVQLDSIVQLMDIACLSSGEHLFHEGDPGTALYVLIHGRVEMYKRRTDTCRPLDGSIDYGSVTLAVCTASLERPWFGEQALWENRNRAASAVCTEPTGVLVLQRADFGVFLDLVPAFHLACNGSEDIHWALRHVYLDSEFDNLSEGSGLGGRTVAVGHWERLTAALLPGRRLRETNSPRDYWLHPIEIQRPARM